MLMEEFLHSTLPNVHKRICLVFKKWIELHPYDFKEDVVLTDTLKKFLYDHSNDETQAVVECLSRARKVKYNQ